MSSFISLETCDLIAMAEFVLAAFDSTLFVYYNFQVLLQNFLLRPLVLW